MAVSRYDYKGTGTDQTSAVTNAFDQFCAQFGFTNGAITTGNTNQCTFTTAKGNEVKVLYKKEALSATASGAYNAKLTVIQSANGVFLYNYKDIAIGAIITMSDGTEWNYYSTSTTDYSKASRYYAGEEADASSIFTTNEPDEGYCIICPIVYRDEEIGAIGATAGDVMRIRGVSNDEWSSYGVGIGDYRYYGYGTVATRVEESS